MKLDVYFGRTKAGELRSTDNRGVIFEYDENYLSDSASIRLSSSLPLQKEEFSQKECIPFFSGLLPEGDSRKKIADYLHVSETSTLKLLESLGGECAGLITLTNEENPTLQKDFYDFTEQNYEPLTDETISDFIKKIPERPLIKADDKLRLSLAGAQEKLALAKFNEKWFLPLNGAPSTHILKPTREGSLSTLAKNEYICMKLAKESGLDVPDVDLINLAEKDIFVVERYDRNIKKNTIQRLHQEDFCQALGIMSEIKYQNDGGPGIKDISNVIKSTMTVPALELQKLLRAIVFNFLIGNCDSHGKNYSLLYNGKKTILAPLYDVVSTTVYSGLTDKLSMKIGKHYEIDKVSLADYKLLSESLGINFSMINSIFAQFEKNIALACSKIENDEKVDKNLLEQIMDGVKQRLIQIQS